MKFIYCRVSDTDQDAQAQEDELREKYPKAELITEQVSSKSKHRKVFDLINWRLRKGDTIIVWKLDRLGRNLRELLELIDRIEAKGAHFISHTQNIDTSNATGRLLLHVLAMVAEFERDTNSERAKLGMARAKREAEAEGREWPKKPAQPNRNGGRKFKFNHPDMVAMIILLKDGGTDWQSILEKVIYKNPDWRCSINTIKNIYKREYARRKGFKLKQA
jgi:DNA invertase Pin-like site-specific DNA recombinase